MTATKTHYPIKREKLLQDRFSLKLLICILGLQASKRVRIFKVKSLQGRARTSPRSLIFLLFSINSMSLVRKNAKEAKHYYLCLPIITKNQTFQKHIFWEALIYTKSFLSGYQKMSKAKTVLSTAASLAASAMLIRSVANDFLPAEIYDYLDSKIHLVSQYFSSQLTIVVEEFQGFSINQVFEAANYYLGNKATTTSAQRFRVGKSEK